MPSDLEPKSTEIRQEFPLNNFGQMLETWCAPLKFAASASVIAGTQHVQTFSDPRNGRLSGAAYGVRRDPSPGCGQGLNAALFTRRTVSSLTRSSLVRFCWRAISRAGASRSSNKIASASASATRPSRRRAVEWDEQVLTILRIFINER
jgi:hypothetical protein